MQDLTEIIDKKLMARGNDISEPNAVSALIRNWTTCQSFLYKNFSVQPLNSEYSQDAVADYQMDKLKSNSVSICDNDHSPGSTSSVQCTHVSSPSLQTIHLYSRDIRRQSKTCRQDDDDIQSFQKQQAAHLCNIPILYKTESTDATSGYQLSPTGRHSGTAESDAVGVSSCHTATIIRVSHGSSTLLSACRSLCRCDYAKYRVIRHHRSTTVTRSGPSHSSQTQTTPAVRR